MSDEKNKNSQMWDERYKEEEFFYGKEANEFLKESLKYIPGKSLKVLCLGEGEGRNAIFLAKKGYKVHATDLSHQGLNKLKNWALEENLDIETTVCDLLEFDFKDESYDMIVSIWCHMPSSVRKKVHKNCLKSLKKTGFFVLQAYTPKQLEYKTGGPSNVDMLLSLSSLKEDMQGALIEILAEEKESYIKEGKGHEGKSSVLNYVGQKK